MKVLLVGNYPPDNQESMLRFAALMQRELAARGHEVRLLQPRSILGSIRMLGSLATKWLAYFDKFILFPGKLALLRDRFDVIHLCDHSNAMYVPRLLRQAHLVTCHDLLAIKGALGETPENIVSATGRFFQRLILNGLKQSQHVVCDSLATQDDLLRLTRLMPSQSSVVYLSLNYPYAPMDRLEAQARLTALSLNPQFPFLLHVGSGAWYKNRRAVLDLFVLLRRRPGFAACRLLFLGTPLEPALRDRVAAEGLDACVDVRSNVANEDLRAAYSLAEAFLFPSLEEGFGWPVLEAQACGCPVFATNRRPMTEIGGEAATYFDPADLPAGAQVIASTITDASLPARGRANAAAFTVDRMITGYLQAYEQVIEQRRARG